MAQSHLCDDGLVFDNVKANAGHVDPCDTPLVVDCTDRPLLRKYYPFYSDFLMSFFISLSLHSYVSITVNINMQSSLLSLQELSPLQTVAERHKTTLISHVGYQRGNILHTT